MKTPLKNGIGVSIINLILMSAMVRSSVVNVNPDSVAVMTATPTEMHEGLTKNLALNCTFASGTDISSVVSISISRSDHMDGAPYVELAQISSVSHNITTKNSLNGHVSGGLSDHGVSFLAFDWLYPTKDILGRYQCSVFSIDTQGHPKISMVTSEVIEQPMTFDLLLAKIMELEKSQTAQNIKIDEQQKVINSQQQQLDYLHSRLNSSTSALFDKHATHGGHTYYLSKKLWRSGANDDNICRMMGGYLLILDNKDEFNWVKSFLQSAHPAPTSVLTGVTEEGHQGKWTATHSGETVTYLNWAHNQPDIISDYTCVYLAKADGWKMSDGPCRRSDWMQMVCEIPTEL